MSKNSITTAKSASNRRQTIDSHTAELINRAIKNDHIIPVKFVYTGNLAKGHLRLAAQDSYKGVTLAAQDEVRLLTQDWPVDAYTVCDIGPGDGRHTASFLQGLRNANRTIPSYLGLDFSKELMAVAHTRLLKQFESHMVSFQQWDIEEKRTAAISQWRVQNDHSLPILITLFGILGNLEDPLSTLKHIRASARKSDRLLISVAMQVSDQTATAYEKPYKNEAFTGAMHDVLSAAELDREDYDLHFTYRNDAVIGECVLLRERLIGQGNMATHLPKESTLRCFISRRFSPEQLEDLLQYSGWLPCNHTYNQGKSIGVFLAKAI